MDRDLSHLYPPFAEKIVAILRMMNEYASVHQVGYTWKIVEGFRTAEYQNKLFKKRPRVTQKDGYVRKSNHQSSMAVDLVPFHGHDFDFDGKQEWWDYLAHCARSQGLKSGNDWKRFKDSAHIEWPTKDPATYKKAREWQKANGLR